MDNVKITALTGISSADVTNEDVFVVVDLSEDETKKITLANIIAAVDTTQLSNVVALQGGLTGSNVRITSEEANVLALQGGLIGANSNQVAIATFADDTGIWQAGNLFPKANGVYSLGWGDALWKDIYMTGGTIFLGNVSISEEGEEGIKITGASGQTATLVTPEAGGAANVSANIALLESNVTILLGSTAGQNTRIASEEANVINLQTGLVGANTALANEISATNVDVTNLVTGIGGSNSRIAAEEANVIALQSGISGSNSRIAAEEANVISLQGGLIGANTNISSNDTDITNLVTGLGGSNTNITALEARRAANTSIFEGAFSGSNTRLAAEEANVIALQGGITGANSAISGNDTDITNLITGLDGANTVIATKAATTYVDAQIAAIVDSAPETLDTLNELAAALGDDANFATTTATQIGTISSNTVNLQTGIAGSNTNITANETRRAANTSIFLGAFTGSNARIAAEEANVIALQGGIAGANTALANEIAETNTDITNLVTGLDGANTNVTALEARRAANTSIFLGAFTGSNARIAAEEANVISLQGGIAGANTALSNEIASTNTDITNLVTGLEGSNTDVTALEARRDSNTSIFLGAHSGANTRIAAEEANVIALQGGIDGANTAIASNDTDIAALEARRAANTAILLGAHSGANTRIAAEEANVIALQGGITGANTNIASNDTDITNLVTGLEGSNTTIATKDSVANVYATYLVAKGGIDGANAAISSNDTDITNLVTGLEGSNTTLSTKASTSYVDSAVAGIVDSAPEALNTLNELAAALGDDANFATTISTQIGTISANTVALQGGIAGSNTSITNLITGLDGSNTSITALEARRNANTAILLGAHSGANARIAAEEANVIALQGGIDGANAAISSNDTDITNLVTGLEGSNTTIATKDSVANVYATYLVAKGGIDGANAAISSNDTDITNLVTGLEGSNTNISSNDTDITNLVTGLGGSNTNITAVEARRTANIAGAVSSITTSDLTASRALTSDESGKVAVSAVTATELGYLDGVTSAIQTQLDAKLEGNQTITLNGDVSGSGTTSITVTVADDSHNHVISNIDNLQTSLDAKDTVANVYATYLVAKGGIDGANSAISSNDTDITNLVTGLGGSNTNITALEARRAANTAILLGAHSGANARIAAEEANVIALQGGIAGANTAIGLRATTASPTFTGVPAAPTAAAGTSTTQIATTAFVGTAVANIVDSAPEALNTLNELAAALGDDANFSTTVSTQIGTISSNTVTNATDITAVESRRVANIAGAVSSITTGDLTASRALVSDGSGKVAVSAVTSTELGYLDGVTSAIQTQLDGKQASGSYLTGNETITLSGDVSGSGTTAITVTVADDSHNHVISNIDNLQTTLDSKDTVANVYATYLVAKGGIDGANTNITAVEARRTANIAGAVSSITTGNLTASRALVSDGSGKVAVSAVTSTELGYLDGVTSAIQTQLDGKQASGSYLTGNQTITLSGDASGSGTTSIVVTVADDSHNHIISNIDGLQTALDAKLASSSYTAADVLTKIKTVDGAGSGLDADLLDGQSSAYYAVEATRSSNAAQLAAGIASAGGTMTAAEIRALGFFDTSNDGAGSGLDADTLDGVQGASYLRSDTSDSITSGSLTLDAGNITVNNGTNLQVLLNASDGAIEITRAAGGAYIDFKNTTGEDYDARLQESGGSINLNGNRILTTADEGSGNGIDADTVDGIQGASFLRSDTADTATGVITLNDDLVFSNRTTTDGHIQLYAGSGATGYAIGVEASTLYNRSGALHRWYIGTLADGGASDYMELSTSGLTVNGTVTATNVDISNSLDIGSEVVLTESTDRADLLLIKSTTGTWGGIQISNSSNEGLWSFMTDGATGGIYDDQNNKWHLQFIENSETRLYHNGAEKLNTDSGGVTITGNIVVSGTVDGRDVASDGTKLDGIESGATADQTAAEILTAIKTVDGSGSGLDADLLDGISSASFLRSDADDAITNTGVEISFYSNDVLETSSGDQATLEVYQDTAGADAFMQFHIGGDYAAYFGLKGDINDFAVGGWSMGATYYRVWHAGNDGSGSGLDADLLDGLQSSTSATASTIAARNGSGDIYMRYGFSTYFNMSHATGTRTSDTIFYSSTDNYIRKTNATGFRQSLGLGSDINANVIPAGFIGMWGAATAPSGWYLCQGGAISRTTYSALFAAIGTTYGTGDGSTTFNVPDFRDRAPYGASTYTLGSKTTNEINGSAQAATSSGGSTSHSVTTSTTNSTTDKDVTNSITVVTGVNNHGSHSHTVTYPAVAVKFIIKT